MDEICLFYGYVCDGYAIDVPWPLAGLCHRMALICYGGAANVMAVLCLHSANNVPR